MIDKKKIVMYAGSTLIGITIGINIAEASFDHTKKACPLCSDLEFVSESVAIDHQIKEMIDDYRDRGITKIRITKECGISNNSIIATYIDKNNECQEDKINIRR